MNHHTPLNLSGPKKRGGAGRKIHGKSYRVLAEGGADLKSAHAESALSTVIIETDDLYINPGLLLSTNEKYYRVLVCRGFQRRKIRWQILSIDRDRLNSMTVLV